MDKSVAVSKAMPTPSDPHRKDGRPIHQGRSRGHVEVTGDLCKGCLLCIEACPPAVLEESPSLNHLGYHPVVYKGDGCTGCGICYYVCPEPAALRVYRRVAGSSQ
jgi:NAD-dependent dihydropyrimidine dehydrogenase PreA subunit